MAHQCIDKDITISPTKGTVAITFNGNVIAKSTKALDLQEGSYPVRIYLPLSDVDEKVLSASDHKSVCPYKGEAAYFSLDDGQKRSENAVWYYPTPCPQVSQVDQHVSFWGDDISCTISE